MLWRRTSPRWVQLIRIRCKPMLGSTSPVVEGDENATLRLNEPFVLTTSPAGTDRVFRLSASLYHSGSAGTSPPFAIAAEPAYTANGLA